MLVAHPGAELYGSDRVLAESVDAMVRAGWPVTVALPGPGPLADRLAASGAEVAIVASPVLRKAALRPAGALRLLRDTLRGAIEGARLLRAVRPRVVYVSTVTLPLWIVLAALARRPVVCHLHEAETGVSRPLRVALAAPLLLAGTIVANSRFSRDTVVGDMGRLAGRAVVVANPVPPPDPVTAVRRAPGPPARLLYVGRLSPRKGPQVAVAALEELVARGHDARLDLLGSVFVGYEWFEAELRREVADRNLGARVRFLGFRDEIGPALAEADVVLVPSLADEPFGNTAVEAVLARRPVVVSRAGGLPEAVEGLPTARVVPPGDAAALATAVAATLDDWDHVRSSVEAAAQVAGERHDPLRYGHRLVDVIDHQARLGRRPRP